MTTSIRLRSQLGAIVALALGASACSGPSTSATSDPSEALAANEEALTCQGTELTWASLLDGNHVCAGEWAYHERCVMRDPSCGPKVPIDAQCELFGGNYTEVEGSASLAGLPEDSSQWTAYVVNSAPARQQLAQERANTPARLRSLVHFDVAQIFCESSSGLCYWVIDRPLWHLGRAHECGTEMVDPECPVAAQKCPNPTPLRYYRAGASQNEVTQSTGDAIPVCTTCEGAAAGVGGDPAFITFECLEREWQRPGIEDGGFEAQGAATLGDPWRWSEGAVTVESGAGTAHGGSKNAILRPTGSTPAAVVQTVRVTPGSRYSVHAFVRTDPTLQNGVLGVRRSGQTGAFAQVAFAYGSSAGAYFEVGLDFTAPTDASGVDVFVSAARTGAPSFAGEWVRVDDVRVEPTDGLFADNVHRRLLQKLKMLYELYASSLDDVRMARLRAYFQLPGAIDQPLGCGDPAPVPNVTASCPAADASRYAAQRPVLEMCSELRQGGSSLAISRELRRCLAAYRAIVAIPSNADLAFDTDTGCAGKTFRDYAYTLTRDLLRKQFELVYDPQLRGTFGALSRQLALIDEWFVIAKRVASQVMSLSNARAAITQDAITNDLSYVMRGLWEAVYRDQNVFTALRDASQRVGSADPNAQESRDAINHELDTLTGRGFVVDQMMIKAAFTPSSASTTDPDGTPLTATTPIHDWPLLMLMGDSLTALSERAEDLSVFHDFACTFRSGCGTGAIDTPLGRTYLILGNLENKTALDSALITSLGLSGWRDTFQILSANQDQLYAALPMMSSSGRGFQVDVPLESYPPAARPLGSILRDARRRALAYQQTGQFEPAARHTLAAGVDVAARESIISEVQTGMEHLRSAAHEYDQGVVGLVNTLIAQVDSQMSNDTLMQERRRASDRWDELAKDYAGLQAAGDADESRFADIAHNFENLRQTIDSGAFFPVANSTHNFDFSGASAGWKKTPTTANDLRAWSAGRIDGIQKGQMIMLQASGVYRPTCSLSSTMMLPPTGGIIQAITAPDGRDVSNAAVGPEGFQLTYSTNHYSASSASSSATSNLTLGLKVELCQGSPGLAHAVVGAELKACAYADANRTWSQSTGDSAGSNSTTAATYSSGLRLNDTPFPTMPVGALVLLFAPVSGGPAVEAHVVANGYNAFVVPESSRPLAAYFVVNDRGSCSAPDATQSVHVESHVVEDASTRAEHVIAAMADVIKKVQALETATIAGGRILPSQSASTRSEALTLLDSATNADAPASVHHLFDAFIDKEILRVERSVEMDSIRREMHTLEQQMANLDQDRKSNDQKSRLQALATRWALRNLAGRTLRNQAIDMLRLVRLYFQPVLELWYPSAVSAFSSSAELNALLFDNQLDTSFGDLIDHASDALARLDSLFRDAHRGQKSPSQDYLVMAVSFPNPYYRSGNIFSRSGFQPGEVSQWYSIWDAIRARRSTSITIRPEDLYGAADATLLCNQVNPVVEKMGLYVVRPGEPDFASLNNIPRNFDSFAASQQVFATPAGPVVYTIDDGSWQYNPLPIVYGEYQDMQSNFLGDHDVSAQRPIGLSPFTTFQVDFSRITGIENAGAASGFDDFASELLVVFELDWKSSGDPIRWAGACNRTH